MINTLSDSIAGFLISMGIISDDDRELYSYAAYNIIFKAVPIIVLFILSICMDKIIENAIIVLVFLSIRKYAGGFHFNKPALCLFGSSVVMAVLLVLSDRIYTSLLMYAVLLISVIIIVCLSPLDSDKRKLDDTEIKEYKIKAVIVLLVILALYTLLCVCHKIIYSNCVFLAIELVLCLQLLEVIKNTGSRP